MESLGKYRSLYGLVSYYSSQVYLLMYNLNYYANYVPYQSKRYNTEINGNNPYMCKLEYDYVGW